MFGWCADEMHKYCIKSYLPYYIDRGKIIYKDEEVCCTCQCHHRSRRTKTAPSRKRK